MTAVADLDTPVVTVDLEIMRDNIRRVQAHLSRHGIGNRPHIKTHKAAVEVVWRPSRGGTR